MGSKTHQTPVHNPDISPPPSQKVRPRAIETPEGGTGGSLGGGWTPGRGAADREKGGNEGGRSQGRDRGDQEEEEEHSWTQATAMMMAHGGADGGRNHGEGMAADSRGPTPGSRPMAAEQVVEGPEVETESQRARGMSRIRGARVEPRALATEVEIKRSMAERLRNKDQGGAGRRKEPNGAGGTE